MDERKKLCWVVSLAWELVVSQQFSKRMEPRQITSSQPLMLLLATAVYDLPTGTVSLCLVVDSARAAVGRSTYASLTVSNSLPDELRNSDSFDSFKRIMQGKVWQFQQAANSSTHASTRNTLDCDQSNVYSSRIVFSAIS